MWRGSETRYSASRGFAFGSAETALLPKPPAHPTASSTKENCAWVIELKAATRAK